jgi:beta-phosphoglucomutase-like phosphatase (HAD superfamily)
MSACVVDLDGVLDETATVHAAVWRGVFDAFLRTLAERTGRVFVPFEGVPDYDTYAVLEASHSTDVFEVCIDGLVAERASLKREPVPDTYLAAAHAPGLRRTLERRRSSTTRWLASRPPEPANSGPW